MVGAINSDVKGRYRSSDRGSLSAPVTRLETLIVTWHKVTQFKRFRDVLTV